MIYKFPQKVESNYNGYEELIKFYHATKELFIDELIVDFSETEWFEANLLAVLGALLSKLDSDLNTVRIQNLRFSVKKIFSKNNFLSYFGGEKLPDTYDTTVKYIKFSCNEEQTFNLYLDNELLSKNAIPKMSGRLRKEIKKSIFEIFSNAVLHGKCNHVYCCGQYYPRDDRLDFTIVDLGRTIRQNVREFLGDDTLTGIEAVKWAVQEGHSTKKTSIPGRSIPGGLGLSLIRDFVKVNKGKIQIISSTGFWQQIIDKVEVKRYLKVFPGSIVNLEFNVNEEDFYYFNDEVNPEDVF